MNGNECRMGKSYSMGKDNVMEKFAERGQGYSKDTTWEWLQNGYSMKRDNRMGMVAEWGKVRVCEGLHNRKGR